MSFTTTDLLSLVSNLASNPALESRLTNANVLSFADLEIALSITPSLVNSRSDFMLTYKECTLSSAGYITIPPRAVNNTIKNIYYSDSAVTTPVELTFYDQRDRGQFAYINSTAPAGYYIEGNRAVMLPLGVSSTGTFRVYFNMRPSRLVATSSARQITAVDPVAGTIVISSSWASVSTTTKVDLIANYNPYPVLGFDILPSNVSGNTIYFNLSDMPADLAVGDWISLAETSPVANIPEEMCYMLAGGVLTRVLESIGDMDGAQMSYNRYQRDEKTATSILAPRSNTTPKVRVFNGLINRPSRARRHMP